MAEKAIQFPEGTITFFFTDVEGSTALWERYPQIMPKVMLRHDAIADEVIRKHNGILIRRRGEGDSHFIVFEDATAAIEAVVALQLAYMREPWPAETPIRVRMALHTGTANLQDEDYRGAVVNRSARIRAVAHGEQIVISAATKSVANLPDDSAIDFRYMGAHRLKDLAEPVELFQVLHPELPADFPALKSLGSFANNLPVMVTSLIGRDRELGEVQAMLGTARIVTIAGSGGSGKTRLAIHAAAEESERFADGVFFIDLSEVRDNDAIGPLIAKTIDLPLVGAQSLESALLDHLANQKILLVFDNCEHVVDAAARWIRRITSSTKDVAILATSREVLNVQGEAVYRVPSLRLPSARTISVREILESEAVQLFAERARMVSPDFEIGNHAERVLSVCRTLDGIPLAIELAAARVRAMPMEQIERGLNDRFRFLGSGSREALPRQQTLRALIDWSYELLDPQERLLLQRLSVFVGSFSLDAITSVCSDESLETYEIFDLVTRLVDKSLLVYESPRYRLLETVRRYASDRLNETGGIDALVDAHQMFYATLVSEQSRFFGSEHGDAFEQVQIDYANIRSTMEAGRLTEVRSKAALQTGRDLTLFWYSKGQYEEGLAILLPLAQRAREISDREAAANLLNSASTMARQRGDLDAAERYLLESLEYRAEDDFVGRAAALTNLASIHLMRGQNLEAISHIRDAMRLAEQARDDATRLRCHIILGNALQQQGDLESARSEIQKAVDLAKARRDHLMLSFALNNLANIALKAGDLHEAEPLFRETIERAYVAHQIPLIEASVRQLAQVWMLQGQPESAAVLEGVALELREAHAMPLSPADRIEYETAQDQLVKELGTAYGPAIARGRSLSLDGIVDYLNKSTG